MNEIAYANRRFDPDIVEFHEHAKAMAKSVGYTATMKIDQQDLIIPPKEGVEFDDGMPKRELNGVRLLFRSGPR